MTKKPLIIPIPLVGGGDVKLEVPPRGDPFWKDLKKRVHAQMRRTGLSHLIVEGPEKLVARYNIETPVGTKVALYRFTLDTDDDAELKVRKAEEYIPELAREYNVSSDAVSLRALMDERTLRNECFIGFGIPLPFERDCRPTAHFYFCYPAEEMRRVGMA